MGKIFKGFNCDGDIANTFYSLPGNKSEILEGLIESYLQNNKNFDLAVLFLRKKVISDELNSIEIEIETKLNELHTNKEEQAFISQEIPSKLKLGIEWGPITRLFNAKFKKKFNPLELRELYYGKTN